MSKAFFILILLFSVSLFGQGVFSEKARYAYENKNYKSTIKFLDKIRFSDLTNEQRFMRAESYLRMHEYDKALHAYENLNFSVLHTDSSYLHYAQVLEIHGEYEEAREYYSLFNKKHPDDVLSTNKIKSCGDKTLLHRFSGKVNIFSFQKNTSENDLVSFLFEDQLIYSSGGHSSSWKKYKWDGQHFLNFYSSIGDTKHVFSKALTSKLHEGPGFYDESKQKLYFTRNAIIHDVERMENISNLKIFESYYDNGKWSKPKELSFNDEMFSRGHPTGLKGGDFLIFSSNQNKGFGEVDLYIVYFNNGQWGIPVNLGNQINTEGQELFPYLANDSTLYFASDGHIGHGGLDLFVCEFHEGHVSNVRNLGKPFNSSRDDFGLIFSDKELKKGYFTSDRENGKGSSDIYSFEIGKAQKVIKFQNPWGKVISLKQGNLVSSKMNEEVMTNENGVISLINVNEDKHPITSIFATYYPANDTIDFSALGDTTVITLYPTKYFTQVLGKLKDEQGFVVPQAEIEVIVDHHMYEGKTNRAGEFKLLLPEKKSYEFVFKKDGFLSNKMMISSESELATSELQKVEKGTILKLNNIYYEFDRDQITSQAKPTLDTLIQIMKMNPNLEIEISSHADSRGSNEYNKDLSLRRAKSVMDYLDLHKIDAERLSIKYYGEKKLANDCGDNKDCLEHVHSRNRRTEFKVIKY